MSRRPLRVVPPVLLAAAAFLAGRASGPGPAAVAVPAHAAQDAAGGIDDAIVQQIVVGYRGLSRAQSNLQQAGRYVPAANGLNAFITLAGGYDVLGSLQAGRGVDPETYAALEAGFAPQQVLTDLGRDADGRLTYRGELIRLMSRQQLRTLYLRRGDLVGEAL